MRIDYYNNPNAPRANSIRPAASAIVLYQDGIVLQRRADSGSWSLPGGVMEPGETIEETCVREVFEETGLRVAVTGLLGIYSDPRHIIRYSDGEIRQQFSICFVCNAVGGSLERSRESLELGTFSLDRLPEPIHDTQLQRLADFRDAKGPYLR